MRTPGEEGIIAARQEALTITEAAPFPHGTCILTGEDGENPDDCTTHGHEAVLGPCNVCNAKGTVPDEGNLFAQQDEKDSSFPVDNR